MSLEIGISPFFCFLLTSDARYFVVETKGNCDLDIGLLANSAFFLQVHHSKSFKMPYIKSLSFFKNMRADFVLRCQKLTSLTTPEMIKKQLISLQK